MIKYGDLVQYIKENHVNWNTDLFDVLRGFFESRVKSIPYNSLQSPTQASTPPVSTGGYQQDLFIPPVEFETPADGEYTTQDLLNLFST